MFGSIVVNGWAAILAQFCLVAALKKVDLPADGFPKGNNSFINV